MRGKRTDLPTTYEGMEQYLLDAWDRVREGRPRDPELAEQAKQRRLKANPSTVSKEAGVSRTLIGYDGCRYPEVRRKILNKDKVAEKQPVRLPSDMRAKNEELKRRNRELESQVKLLLSERVAMLNRMQKLEAEYIHKEDEINRINSRADRNPNQVAGLHILRPDKKN